ncbi:ribosome maturation factor RimM, partial [Streptomyces sp. NPDC058953]|uniref:ribosome maturation factor RimM n=1 Tax=Streptomyces sp. NPDC058953 TaxID=3346676 RepID=UPI003685C0A8
NYDHQLVDLDVVLADGSPLGPYTEISHLPSQDLFIVERPDGDEVMIPFVEEIVVSVDLGEQRIVVAPPPGLLDDRAEIASARDAEGSGEDADGSDAADASGSAESGDASGPGPKGGA